MSWLECFRIKKIKTPSVTTVQTRRTPSRTSHATCLPLEILDDILSYLSRCELEKCQLVCLFWKYYVEDYGTSLAYRSMELFELGCNGFIEVPNEMRNIEIVDVAKVLRYALIENCRISFTFHVFRTLVKLKEFMQKPLSVNKFTVNNINHQSEFANNFKFLDVIVKELVKSYETRIYFSLYQLAYLVQRPDLLNISKPTRVIIEIDNSRSIYTFPKIDPIIEYIFPSVAANESNRYCLILDSLTVGADFVLKICEKFLIYEHLESIFKIIEVWPRSSTVVRGKRYLKEKGYSKCKIRIESEYGSENLAYNYPYIVERKDGWCLLICLQNFPNATVEGEEYRLTFFVRDALFFN